MQQRSEPSERQKCLNGEEFDSSDPELMALIVSARSLGNQYNAMAADDAEGRRQLLTRMLGSLGDRVYIDTPFYCDYGKNIEVGDNVYIGLNCTWVDNNRISIGNNVLIGSGVNISTASHPLDAAERIIQEQGKPQGYRTTSAPVSIDDNAWIGSGVTIIAGVTIGKNTTIGAGSVVVKDIPANCVAVGNPCRVIKQLKP